MIGNDPERSAANGVSVVIPALDEGRSIRAVLAEVARVLSGAGIGHELLVVDDGSADDTAEAARAAGATVISHPENQGYGRSLKTGIAHARYDLIAITDADGTYPPECLPGLIRLADRYHMVVGQRTGRVYAGGASKRVGRALFRWLAEFAAGRRIPDINSGVRVFRRSEIVPFFPSISTGFSFTTTATLVYLLNGMFVGYVPIAYHSRTGKSKVRYFRDTLRAVQIVVEAILRYNPIKVFLLAAFPFAVAAAACLLVTAVLLSSVWALAAVVAAGVATLVLCLGFLAVALSPGRPAVTDRPRGLRQTADRAADPAPDAMPNPQGRVGDELGVRA